VLSIEMSWIGSKTGPLSESVTSVCGWPVNPEAAQSSSGEKCKKG
jgi:hypothetical protein